MAIYARSSSKMQRMTSTEDQIRERRDEAARRGWTVVEEYVIADEAKTGQLLSGRDGLDRLVELAEQENRPFDAILMDDSSRFGRSLSDTLPILDRLTYAGVFLYFVSNQLDSRDKHFRSQYIRQGEQDEQYTVGLGDKVHRGMRGRVLNGFAASGRQYGFVNEPVPMPDQEWRYGRAAIQGVRRKVNEQQRGAVERMFDLYMSGNGYGKIARILNEEGVPPISRRKVKSRFWSKQSVKNILQNEAYRGWYIWNKTETVLNRKKQRKEHRLRPESEWERVEHPEWRIIPEEKWQAVVRERERRTNFDWRTEGGFNRAKRGRYLLSGSLKCGVCGGDVSIVKGRKGDMAYGCRTHHNSRACTNRRTVVNRLLEPQLKQAIARHLSALGFAPD